MRTAVVAIGVVVAVSACGSTDDAGRTDSVASTTVPQAAEEPGELRANQPPTDREQQAARAAELEREAFVESCTENVPALAVLGVEQASTMWDDATQDEAALRRACTELAETDPEQRTALETAIEESEDALASDEAAQAATTTTDPTKPYITIACPPEETEAEGAYRAEFDVETTSRAEIDEWGIDYGDGRSYSVGIESVAESELYWHNYYATGDYEVTAWIIDEDGERAEATCLVRWTN